MSIKNILPPLSPEKIDTRNFFENVDMKAIQKKIAADGKNNADEKTDIVVKPNVSRPSVIRSDSLEKTPETNKKSYDPISQGWYQPLIIRSSDTDNESDTIFVYGGGGNQIPAEASRSNNNAAPSELIESPEQDAIDKDSAPVTNRHGFDRIVYDAILKAAAKHGVDPNLMLDIAKIESSGRPNARSENKLYGGLFQLSLKTYGSKVFNPEINADLAARELKSKITKFNTNYGRSPTATEIYMAHQQGEGGAAKHIGNPYELAWVNMYNTGEGRKKGKRWAQSAITSNIPSDMRASLPPYTQMTSAQFMAAWTVKLEGISYQSALARYELPSNISTQIASLEE